MPWKAFCHQELNWVSQDLLQRDDCSPMETPWGLVTFFAIKSPSSGSLSLEVKAHWWRRNFQASDC